jgi:hypothetical protein
MEGSADGPVEGPIEASGAKAICGSFMRISHIGAQADVICPSFKPARRNLV